MPFPGSTLFPGSSTFPGGRIAAWPQVSVAIEFTAGTWTDVTKYCRKVTAQRGRQYEMAQADAGKLQLELINTDGRFDPANASSPYYPNVLLRKRVRLRLALNGVTKDLWLGYVTSWPQTFGEAGNFQSTPLEAFDLLGALKQKTFGPHMAAEVINQLNPLYWWPLEAQDNSNRTPEIVNGAMYGQILNAGGSGGVKCGGGATLAGGLENVAQAQFTSGTMGSASAVPMGIVNLMRVVNGQALQLPSQPFTIGFVVQSQGKPVAASTIIEMIDSTATRQYFRVYVDNQGRIGFVGVSQDSAIYNTVWPQVVADGNPHYVALELSGTPPKFSFSVDGGTVGTIDSGNPTYGWRWNNLVDLNIGGTWARQGSHAAYSWAGYIGNVAIFPGALVTNGTMSGPNALPQVTINGNVGTTTDEAIQNLMTVMQRGSQFTALGTGATSLQRTVIGAQDAATVLQNIMPWEQGNLYTNGSGNLQFSPRTFRYNPTSAYTIGGGASSTYHFTKVATDYDDTKMLNQAIVNRTDGATYIVDNKTAQNTYGLYSQTFSNEEVQDDQQALAQGQYIVRRFSQPGTRISAVLIDVAADPTNMVPFIMNTDIDSCVTVQHTPLAGVPQSQTCWIESVKYTIAAGTSPKFEVEHNLTPVDSSQYLTIGTSLSTSAIDNASYVLSF